MKGPQVGLCSHEPSRELKIDRTNATEISWRLNKHKRWTVDDWKNHRGGFLFQKHRSSVVFIQLQCSMYAKGPESVNMREHSSKIRATSRQNCLFANWTIGNVGRNNQAILEENLVPIPFHDDGTPFHEAHLGPHRGSKKEGLRCSKFGPARHYADLRSLIPWIANYEGKTKYMWQRQHQKWKKQQYQIELVNWEQ